MNILIISSCTSTKSLHHPEQLTLADFRHPDNPQHLADRCSALRAVQPSLEVEARRLYTGRQHEYVIEGVDRLRRTLGDAAHVELQIVSAGYGLVGETDKLLPYQATFNDMRKREAQEYARQVLQLPERIHQAIEGKDLVIFLLGEAYLQTLDLQRLESRPGLVFVAGSATSKWFPRAHRYSLVMFTNDDVKTIGGGQVGLKGAILKRLAVALTEVPHVSERIQLLQRLAATPASLRAQLNIPQQMRLPVPEVRKRRVAPELHLRNNRTAKNAGPRPKFFVPDWDDLVNPAYDFLNDAHSENGGVFDPYTQGKYAHEVIEGVQPYDGLLVSRTVASGSKVWKRAQTDGKNAVHSILRWPGDRPIMGDCGAFSYLKQEVPPYSTDDVLHYYHHNGFDIGVSVDHLIVGEFAADPAERQRRFDLTVNNAAEFLQKYRANHLSKPEGDIERYRFRPMGIAQGWDLPSYVESVRTLLEMGYKHIALGSLAFAKSQFAVDILARISPMFPEDLYVHVFGLAREELLAPYAQYGVTAFDSATFLRRSWMSARDNYLDPTTGEWYAAIRIPPSRFTVNGHERFHSAVKPLLVPDGPYRYEQIAYHEQLALTALRAYASTPTSSLLEDALAAVLAYDEIVMPGKGMEDLYRRTLEDRPWERCGCSICKDLGVEVVIFRQNDRNRRRGFHNTYAFKRIEEAKWSQIMQAAPAGHR